MKINWIKYKNFRGLRDLTLVANGGDLNIFAANGVGKTTCTDGVSWLIDGKDSRNSAKFEIKTMVDGVVQHNLEHSVEMEIEHNGETIVLGKTFKEVWSQPKGKPHKELTTHTTMHFVNGVKKDERIYQDFVNGIFDVKKMRILCDPTNFSSDADPKFGWKGRREILVATFGDVSDSDVIEANKKLSKLPDILGKKTLADYREILASDKRNVDEQLKSIPIEINTINEGMGPEELPPASDPAELTRRIVELQQKKALAATGGAAAEKMVELRELESKIQGLENHIRNVANAVWNERDDKLRAVKSECDNKVVEVKKLKEQITEAETLIKQTAATIESSLAEWRKIKAETFEFSGSDTCAACGQSLPADKVQSAKEKAEEEFNLSKSKRLEANVESGKKTSAYKKMLEENTASAKQRLSEAEVSLKALEQEVATLTETRGPSPIVDFASNPEHVKLKKEYSDLEAEIALLQSGASPETDQIDKQIEEAQALLNEVSAAKLRIAERQKSLDRIKEKESRQSQLATEYERMEAETYLIEEFQRCKVKMLDKKVNSHFKLVDFKLFEDQMNGGLKEMCTPTIDGRPYDTMLSTSERLKVGLDIIETLGTAWGFTPPVFVDNAESTSEIPATTAQQIRFKVDPRCKSFRIETPEQTAEREAKEAEAMAVTA